MGRLYKNIVNFTGIDIEFEDVYTLSMLDCKCFEIVTFQNKITPIEYIGGYDQSFDTIVVVSNLIQALRLVKTSGIDVDVESIYMPCSEEVVEKRNAFGKYHKFTSLRSIGNFTKLLLKIYSKLNYTKGYPVVKGVCVKEGTCECKSIKKH